MLCAFIHCLTCHCTPIGLERWDSACLHCPFHFHWKVKEFSGLIWTTESSPRGSRQVLLWVHLRALGVTLAHSDCSSVEAEWTVSAEVGLTIRETRTQNFGLPSTSLTWPPEWSFKASVLICHIFFRSFQICPCSEKCKPTGRCRKCITCTFTLKSLTLCTRNSESSN